LSCSTVQSKEKDTSRWLKATECRSAERHAFIRGFHGTRYHAKDVARAVAFYTQHAREARSISCAERLRWPPLGAQSRKTRMYAWFQPLLIGDSTEERRQQISLLRAERHKERFLVVARDTANRFRGLASLVREVQGIATPVGRIGAPFNHAALFELVDQHDKSAGQDAEVFRERLLADPTGRVHHAQNAGMRR
jgi:hypothetical protein